MNLILIHARNLNTVEIPSIGVISMGCTNRIINIENPCFLTLTELLLTVIGNRRSHCLNFSRINRNGVNHRASAGNSRHNIRGRVGREDRNSGGSVVSLGIPSVNDVLVVETVVVGIQHNCLTSTNDSSVSSKLQVATEDSNVNLSSGRAKLATRIIRLFHKSGHSNSIKTRLCNLDTISCHITITPCIFISINSTRSRMILHRGSMNR